MRWEEVCEHQELQDLPFKIELNKWGQIVMSPVKIDRSFYQGRIQRLLQSLLGTGEVSTVGWALPTDHVQPKQ
jgi:hypothetical protein